MAVAGSRAVIVLLAAIGGAAPARAQQEDVERGRQLFAGSITFARRGPACAACHDMSALPGPGGGTMGPDLTDVAARIGPQGITTALETLYFPTMAPLFSAHPLTAAERQDVAAFLESRHAAPRRSGRATFSLGAAAIVGSVLLLGITGFAGRTRIHSVRQALLARAAAGRKAAS